MKNEQYELSIIYCYYNEINNKPLTIKQKIYKHVFCKTIERPMLKLVGWVLEKLEK